MQFLPFWTNGQKILNDISLFILIPTIVGLPYPRGLWFDQITWSWRCLNICKSFCGQRIFKNKQFNFNFFGGQMVCKKNVLKRSNFKQFKIISIEKRALFFIWAHLKENKDVKSLRRRRQRRNDNVHIFIRKAYLSLMLRWA